MASVVIIGSGGREHAMAWKLAQSKAVRHVVVAPGNGGTQTAGGKISNLPVDTSNHAAVIAACQQLGCNLVVVGPEVPLAAGIVDDLRAAGFHCFGPTKAAAQIEASKAFSKDFMLRHGIPTARYQNFTEYKEAAEYIETVPYNVVVKASGLCAGKGVLIPTTKQEAHAAIKAVMVDKCFEQAGDEVVIEEFLEGPEASVLAFVDGKTVVCCPAAQDHKRIGEGDTGLNTGGMGAYCPAPVVTPALMEEIRRTIVQPAVDGMAKEGCPFVGCLFTGVMLTKDGPRCLEYNARFGDPETEAVLPLLNGGEEDSKTGGADLYEIMSACAQGTLDRIPVKFYDKHAAVVVMASEGYPNAVPKGRKITGLTTVPGVNFFHAGTAIKDGDLVTNGGRVLAVCGVADSLRSALANAYSGVSHVSFQGAQFRRDIAHRAKAPLRIGVLGSTRGTDMQAIIDAIEAKACDATIEVVISNKPDSGILEKARKHSLNWYVVSGKIKEQIDAETTAVLKRHNVELVLLIGYMRILGSTFTATWQHRAMNVHPSLLPKHAGSMNMDTHAAVLAAGDKETGCTVHWVDAEVDAGGILMQKSCPVEQGDTPESLKQKVQALEGQALLECIALFAEHRLPGLVNYNQKKRTAR